MEKYQANYFKDGDYIGVEFPALPGCFSQGDDMEDAKYWAARAIDCYFGHLNDNSHKKMYNLKTDKTIVIPMHKKYLGEKLQEKILEAAGL